MNSELQAQSRVAFVDLERELSVTRTVLERLPDEHFGWKPHEKSMTLGRLASHVADLPGWMLVTLSQDELDFSTSPPPPPPSATRQDLLARFDKNAATVRRAVAQFDPASFSREWTLRNGQQVLTTRPRDYAYRVWCVNHLVHHRAQLCLYLRLLNIAVPTVYFNTADDPTWVFA